MPTTRSSSSFGAGPVAERLARPLREVTGTGSPTVVMEGGDEDTSDSYAFAERSISEVGLTCA
jgi:hypothetical protein